jgi:hypothetical protein
MKPTFLTQKTVKDKVLFLLKEIPKLRESDNDLIATFIYNELGKQEVEQMSALDLLAKMSNSKLTPFETIRRARIDIQKNFEELKGAEFGKRKKTQKNLLFKVNIREK